MLQYFLQIILFQLAFLLIYELLLKKETFFNANRAYLIITPILALLLPLLKIESLGSLFPAESVQGFTPVWLPEVFIGTQPQSVEQLPEVVIENKGFQINWWLLTYAVGFFGALAIFLRKLHSLNRLFRFRKISKEKDFEIVEVPNSNIACTFYKTVFLGDKLEEAEKQQILSHELVHIKQKHSLDLLIFELLKIVFWFNPLVYIFQNRISSLHEFIADASVVKTTQKRNYYEQLLNSAFNTQNISFINQFFNHSLIKKRIIMLQKSKSKSIAKFKFLIIVPLLLVMLTYVACSEDSEQISQNDQTISEKIAEIKMAIDNGKELTKEEKQEFFLLMQDIVEKGDFPTKSQIDYSNASDVPFAVIDEVPAFEGCEDEQSDARKACTSEKIKNFVNENFDSDIGDKLGLTGVNRVIVQFKIDNTGQIVEVKARAAKPELEEEAKRVIASMPKMTPGRHQGNPVNVMYSLPIVFQVGDQTSE
ncbi:M56 family metallopeptidase [Salegentibacter sp. HM20]